MNKNDKLKLSSEIKYDCETGVFDNFPKLKSELLKISDKLIESAHVINSSKELNNHDNKTLSIQGYIERDYNGEYVLK